MNILQIGIVIFVVIETLNIILLYFFPSSTKGNSVGVFKAYHNIEEKSRDLVSYLVNWVAGAKLIFIMVGVVVVVFGNYLTQQLTVMALVISILSFYWRLFPLIRKLDQQGELVLKGYSKTLNFMILSFIVGFLAVLVISFI